MPGVTKYLPYMRHRRADAYRAQEDAVRKELDERVKQIEINWKYYRGEHKDHLGDDGTNTNDNVKFNLYGLAISKGAADLIGSSEDGVISGPKFDVVGDEKLPPSLTIVNGQYMRPAVDKSPEQLWLDAMWEANNKELFLHNLAVSSGVTGHNFIKIIPDVFPAPENALPVDNGTEMRLPRLILLNPCHITAFWDESDKDRVLAYRIQYGREGHAKRQEIIWQDANGQMDEYGTYVETQSKGWLINDWEQRDGNRTWVLVDSNLWGYDWPPIVQWQNLPNPNAFYGCEDVEKANRDLNDSLNFVASNIQRIIKYHADPKGVATGVNPSDKLLEQAANSMLVIQNENAKVYNVEMESDLSSSTNFMKIVRRGFFDGVNEIDPATVEDRVGDLTNFGLRVLFSDKTKKSGTKRMMCGMGLTDINQHVLELGGFGERRKVSTDWPVILPDDAVAEATALTMDRQQGLSEATYLERRGFDVELEAKRRAQESAVDITKQRTLQQGAKLDALRNGVTNNAR
jgi:hypothetical protein